MPRHARPPRPCRRRPFIEVLSWKQISGPRRPQRRCYPAHPRSVPADAPAVEPSPARLPETRPLQAASALVRPRLRLQTVAASRPPYACVLSEHRCGEGGGKNGDGAECSHSGHWLSPRCCREETVPWESRSDIQSKVFPGSRAREDLPAISSRHGWISDHSNGWISDHSTRYRSVCAATVCRFAVITDTLILLVGPAGLEPATRPL